MATVEYADGTQIEFSGNPTPADIESAHSSATGGSQQMQQSNSNPVLDSINNYKDTMEKTAQDASLAGQTNSPLHLVDSLKVGLLSGDLPDQERFLKTKFGFVQNTNDGNFLVGNDPQNLQRVNPDGLFNDIPAKLAQMVGPLVVGAGAVGGALAASPVGGEIPGAMAGATAASGMNKYIAKSLGLDTRSTEDLAVDTAIDAISAGTGEVGGILLNKALKSAGSGMIKAGLGSIEKLIGEQTTTDFAKLARANKIAGLIEFGTGWNKDDIVNSFMNGIENTFGVKTAGEFANIPRGSETYLVKLTNVLNKTINRKSVDLSADISIAERNLFNKTKGSYLQPSQPLQENVLRQMEQSGLGTISGGGDTPLYFKFRNDLVTDTDKKYVAEFTKRFKQVGGNVLDETKSLEINPEHQIDLHNLGRLNRDLNNSIKGINNSTNPDGELATRLLNIKNGNDNPFYGSKEVGVSHYIENIAREVGDTSYINTRKAFEEFRNVTSAVKNAGLDLSNPLTIQSSIQSGFGKNPILKDSMVNLDRQLGTNFKSEMEMWKSAYTGSSTNPNFLRLNFVMGILGLNSVAMGNPAAKAAMGLTLGTAKGATKILKVLDKANVINSYIQKGFGAASKEALGSTIGAIPHKELLSTLIGQTVAGKGSSTVKGLRNSK